MVGSCNYDLLVASPESMGDDEQNDKWGYLEVKKLLMRGCLAVNIWLVQIDIMFS